MATVGYAYQITSSADLNGRSGPKTSTPIVQTYAPGTTVTVVCQTAGTKVGTTSVWNKLTDGNYVSDYYVSTPSNTTYSAPLPRCTYPFQVTIPTLNKRTGPGSSYAISGTLPERRPWLGDAASALGPRSARRRSGTGWMTASTSPTSIWRRRARRRTARRFPVADLATRSGPDSCGLATTIIESVFE